VRAQPVPDHALEPADGGLGAGTPVISRLNLDSYGGGFTARTLTFLMFWLISA